MTNSPPKPATLPTSAPATSRRKFLGGAGLLAAGLAGGAVAGGVVGYQVADEPESSQTQERIVPFYGKHQAGISTTAQDRLMFASLDIVTTDVTEVAHLLGRWAAMAARFCEGKEVTDATDRPEQPPKDTGETMGLPAENLTVTVGFGASMFDERFGLAAKMPAALQPLGKLPGSAVLDPVLSDEDLCIQACADDPQVVFHAVRNMVRAAPRYGGAAVVSARLWPGIGHRCRSAHTAQSFRIQGRHQ